MVDALTLLSFSGVLVPITLVIVPCFLCLMYVYLFCLLSILGAYHIHIYVFLSILSSYTYVSLFHSIRLRFRLPPYFSLTKVLHNKKLKTKKEEKEKEEKEEEEEEEEYYN